MASKDKRFLSKIRLPKLGSRDRKVKPVVEDNSGNELNEIRTVSNQVENKMTERELKKIKKIDEERMKAIDKDNRRMKRRMLRKQVRKDIVMTSTESCATFCFVFIVGSTLLGGGTALIISGKENGVFDFIVVGATGIVCGIIFTVTGLSLFIKPLYDKHKERKAKQLDSWGEQGIEEPTTPYIGKEHAQQLNTQIHEDKRQKRRPSHADLYYGDETSFDNATALTTPRDESFTSYTEPPYLAVPNNERDSFKKKPVLLLNAKEPRSPQKSKSSKEQTALQEPKSSNETDPSVSNNQIASISHVNETADKQVSFSSEDDVMQRGEANYRVPNDEEQIKIREDSSNYYGNQEISNFDKVFKHPSKSTVVIDYSLLNDLETPPATPQTRSSNSIISGSDEDKLLFTTSQHQRMDMKLDTTSRSVSTAINSDEDDDGQVVGHLDLTEKLYEKHPEIVENHKKRSKREHRKRSEKVIVHRSQSEITVPVDDSEVEEAESVC